MPKKPSRNMERLNYLFAITRLIDELPLTEEEIEALPTQPTRTSGLTLPRVNEDLIEEGEPPIDDPINNPIDNQLEELMDMFGDMRNPLAVVSINQLDEEKKEETQNQKIIREIDENPDKVKKVQDLLNESGGKQFGIEEAARIIFLTLQGTDEKINDIIGDLGGN